MASVWASAPGKCILTGEHAVVYGKTAVAASVGLRTFTELIPSSSSSSLHLSLPNLKIERSWENIDSDILSKFASCPIATTPEALSTDQNAALDSIIPSSESPALRTFIYLFLAANSIRSATPSSSASPCTGLSVRVVSTLPIGAGLGSSASYCTSLATALLQWANALSFPSSSSTTPDRDSLERINQWAFAGEKIIHGNPSGVDNSVATFGGALTFTAGKIDTLPRVPPLRLLLTNTRVSRNTKALVAGVRERHTVMPSIVQPIIDSVDFISKELVRSLADSESDTPSDDLLARLSTLFDMNHHLLNAMGVGHSSLERVRQLGSQHAGLTTKLTGAGGGGCAITLVTPSATAEQLRALQTALSDEGMESFELQVGGCGAQIHLEIPSELSAASSSQ